MPVIRLNGCQVRAARAMLGWSVRELAERSEVSESSIRRIEAIFGAPENVTLDLLIRLQKFFETRGFHFIPDDDPLGPGVQWKRKERRKSSSFGGGGSIDTAAMDFNGGLALI